MRIRWVNLDDSNGISAPFVSQENICPVIKGETASMVMEHMDGGACRFTCVPVRTGEKRCYAVELSESMNVLKVCINP